MMISAQMNLVLFNIDPRGFDNLGECRAFASRAGLGATMWLVTNVGVMNRAPSAHQPPMRLAPASISRKG